MVSPGHEMQTTVRCQRQRGSAVVVDAFGEAQGSLQGARRGIGHTEHNPGPASRLFGCLKPAQHQIGAPAQNFAAQIVACSPIRTLAGK